MPVKTLPANASIDHLRHQAKDLIKAVRSCDAMALQRLREFHPDAKSKTDQQIAELALTLSDAQLAVAREYGFASWPRLHQVVHSQLGVDPELPHHERIDDPLFRRAVDLLDEGNIEALRLHLLAHPAVLHQRMRFEGGNYFQHPTLLAFIAENPVRNDHLPSNIVDVARLILDRGVEASVEDMDIEYTLSLVSSGRVVREHGAQVELIKLLCAYGADPGTAMGLALSHGEFDAASALIECGAEVDLVAAAASGRIDVLQTLLPDATDDQRHQALALSAQHGQLDAVTVLLDAGEDPNRYNPVGCDAHSTPLHQAALAGHFAVVKLLVERGARVDMPDILFDSVAGDWAHHGGHEQIATWLRQF